MAKIDTMFTVAGITTHAGQDATGIKSERTKVRYGTDLIRLIKMLNNPKKIEDKRLGICLAPVRVDVVELPAPMLKADALAYLMTHAEFQSAADQATIQDEIADRAPKVPRVKREPKAKTAKPAVTLDSIKSRARIKATPEQVLAAIVAPTVA